VGAVVWTRPRRQASRWKAFFWGWGVKLNARKVASYPDLEMPVCFRVINFAFVGCLLVGYYRHIPLIALPCVDRVVAPASSMIVKSVRGFVAVTQK